MMVVFLRARAVGTVVVDGAIVKKEDVVMVR